MGVRLRTSVHLGNSAVRELRRAVTGLFRRTKFFKDSIPSKLPPIHPWQDGLRIRHNLRTNYLRARILRKVTPLSSIGPSSCPGSPHSTQFYAQPLPSSHLGLTQTQLPPGNSNIRSNLLSTMSNLRGRPNTQAKIVQLDLLWALSRLSGTAICRVFR